MRDFKEFIERYTTISGKDWETISKAFTQREITKNEIILQEGKVCRNFYFLESGLLRYFYNVDGNTISNHQNGN